MIRKASCILCLAVAFTLSVGAVWAYQVRDVQIANSLYGNLDQHDVPVFGLNACGPASVTNSFVYLQNRFSGFYSNNLIPSQAQDLNNDQVANFYDDMIATTQTLSTDEYMRTVSRNYTYHDDLIWATRYYLEQRHPGVSLYKAQDHWSWTNQQRPKPSFVQNLDPTWNFLYDELNRNADVEILLSWNGGGHFVTVNGFHWADTNSDGLIEQTENAYISFLNPWTGNSETSTIWYSTGTLYTSYMSGSWISMASSIVPVPEPSSILAFACGICGLGVVRRNKWRRAC